MEKRKRQKDKRNLLPVYGLGLTMLLVLTVLFCCYPTFHPEELMGIKYRLWLDALFHGGYFFVLTLCVQMLALRTLPLWACAAVLLLISTALEILQFKIPGRSFSFYDLGANLAGIFLATVLANLLQQKRGYAQQRVLAKS